MEFREKITTFESGNKGKVPEKSWNTHLLLYTTTELDTELEEDEREGRECRELRIETRCEYFSN